MKIDNTEEQKADPYKDQEDPFFD